MAPPVGIIITVTVIVAAGIAAYENPKVREWVAQSRRKIAIALHALGDDISPPSRSSQRDDPSIREDITDVAEERRRQARAEIMERGRIMEEKRQCQKSTSTKPSPQGSFDALVDEDGKLRRDESDRKDTYAKTTAVEPVIAPQGVVNRRVASPAQAMRESVDAPIMLRQLNSPSPPIQPGEDPFASNYEQEMRNTWNLPLPRSSTPTASTHASESLIDLTPTSEHPDPDFSVPESTTIPHALDRSEYFSANASTSFHNLLLDQAEYQYARPSNPTSVMSLSMDGSRRPNMPLSISSAPSIAGSLDHIDMREGEVGEDGSLSDLGDGVRTPASSWTEVGSVVSNDTGH